jgi:hypothetical protein
MNQLRLQLHFLLKVECGTGMLLLIIIIIIIIIYPKLGLSSLEPEDVRVRETEPNPLAAVLHPRNCVWRLQYAL